MAEIPRTPFCWFCGKDEDRVRKLIASSGVRPGKPDIELPSVFICNECIELCNFILADTAAKGEGGS